MSRAEDYADALNQFVTKLAKIRRYTPSEMQDASSELCPLLNIARAEVSYYANPWQEKNKSGSSYVIYQYGNVDNSRAITIREVLGRGGIVLYYFAPSTGAPDWTKDDLDRIKTFQKLLLTFGETIRISRIADEQKYNDPDMGVRTLAFLIQKLDILNTKKEIEGYGVCYFNIRRMSLINKQLGRRAGSRLMKQFVTGLQGQLKRNEYVCRVSGDNFIVLFEKEHFDSITGYLCGTEIFDSENNASYKLSAHQGYYIIQAADYKKINEIIDLASFVENLAKNNPDLPYIVYDDEIRQKESSAREIESLFEPALNKEEFLVYYQPKVTLNDYTLFGAEALCRWKHNGEMIQPYRFIPVLEKSARICELDFYMLEHVCRDIQRWLAEGKKPVKVSVNLSRVHLGDAELAAKILRIIDKYQIPHSYIEIELTETTTEVDYKELQKLVNSLAAEEIGTSIDDFGTGYSSLGLICDFPWSMLKIDKSFLPSGNGDDDRQKLMLKHITSMAQDLNLQCITEGVETPDQVMLLKECNCLLAQGFYFDRPLPVEEFELRLAGKRHP